MNPKHIVLKAGLVSLLLLPAIAHAQGTAADYERANGLRKRFQDAAVSVPERASWIEKTNHFWYRRSTKGGNEFVLVDAERRSNDEPSITRSLRLRSRPRAARYIRR